MPWLGEPRTITAHTRGMLTRGKPCQRTAWAGGPRGHTTGHHLQPPALAPALSSPSPWSPTWKGCAQSTHTTPRQRRSAREGNRGCRDDAWPWTWLQSQAAPQNSRSLAHVSPRDKDRRIPASRLSSAVSHTPATRGKGQPGMPPRAGTPCTLCPSTPACPPHSDKQELPQKTAAWNWHPGLAPSSPASR